jgi:glutathione peroxidase
MPHIRSSSALRHGHVPSVAKRLKDSYVRDAGLIGYGVDHIRGSAPAPASKTNRIARSKILFCPQITVRSIPLNGTIEITMHSSLHSLEPPIKPLKSCCILLLASALLACASSASAQRPSGKHAQSGAKPDQSKSEKTIYDYSLVDQDGKVVPLSTYKGKLLLIVNLASKSIYSSQIAALNDLQKTYGPKGLQIIGVPSADFGGQELKDAAALRKYYADAAQFPVFATASLTGVNRIPLYEFLCDPKDSVPGGDLRWNYTKFLIDRQGHPLARYEVGTDPADIDFHVNIENALAGKLKKAAGGGGKPKGSEDAGGRDDDDDE